MPAEKSRPPRSRPEPAEQPATSPPAPTSRSEPVPAAETLPDATPEESTTEDAVQPARSLSVRRRSGAGSRRARPW